MIITKNNNKQSDYTTLSIKLHSPELLKQGVGLMIDNKKELMKDSDYYKKHSTVLAYNNETNEFFFMNLTRSFDPNSIKTTIGDFKTILGLLDVHYELVEEFGFPQNTLVSIINQTNTNLTELIKDDSYAKTIIKDCIKQAELLLESQFMQAALANNSIETIIEKEYPERLSFNRGLFIDLFPQLKTDELKKQENALLLRMGNTKQHSIIERDALLKSLERVTETMGLLFVHYSTHKRVKSMKRIIDNQNWDCVTEEELLELFNFMQKEYLKTFIEEDQRTVYKEANCNFLFLQEYYLLLITRVIQLIQERKELDTTIIRTRLSELGAGLFNHNWSNSRQEAVSLSLLMKTLITMSNYQNTLFIKGVHWVDTIQEEFSLKNRKVFVEKELLEKALNDWVVFSCPTQQAFVQKLIKFLRTNSCSFVMNEETIIMINRLLDNRSGINNESVVQLLELLAENALVKTGCQPNQLAFFYDC